MGCVRNEQRTVMLDGGESLIDFCGIVINKSDGAVCE